MYLSKPELTAPLDGFQLLHAVYVVEKLLLGLISRRCKFHIICFDENAHLCIPSSHRDSQIKYRLARSVIVRHLESNLPSNLSNFKQFASFRDASFARYLQDSGVYFMMCHDGADEKGRIVSASVPETQESRNGQRNSNSQCIATASPSREGPDLSQKAHFRAMILWFVRKHYNVALINELQFRDTKVSVPCDVSQDTLLSSLRLLLLCWSLHIYELPKDLAVLVKRRKLEH